jgi:hypothetical protein
MWRSGFETGAQRVDRPMARLDDADLDNRWSQLYVLSRLRIDFDEED